MSTVDDLRTDLEAAGFTVSAIGGLWGPDAAAALHRGNRAPAVRAIKALRSHLSALPPVGVLAETFVLGLPVGRADLDRALPTLGASGAEELGLVVSVAPSRTRHGRLLAPRLDLRPYEFTDARGTASWWVASDLGELVTHAPLREDHVLGIGGASMTLSGLMFSSEVDSVLDLGTGCGIQAMHASRSARRVVATDISRRAIELATINAGLNRLDNIEFRLGDLYEPVEGERFDRVVSNPPFVITPRRDDVPAYEYRDGGLEGDSLVEAVLTGAAAQLLPGGTAQLLGNWEYRTDAAGTQVGGLDRVRDWLDEVGLEYWIIEREVQSPAEYAETWIRDGGTRPGTHDHDRLMGAWLDDFAERGVTGVGFGYVVLRAPADGASGIAMLRRTEELHGPLGDTEPMGIGAHLEACISARDTIAALDDEELAAVRVRTAGDVTEERHYWPGDDNPSAMLLRQGGGFGRAITLDTALAGFVGACDGDLPVGVICAALAELLEVPTDALTADLLPAVRELVTVGMLLPA